MGNEIEKGRVQQLQKKLDQKRAVLDWGVPLEQLPVMEWDDYVDQCKNGRKLISVAGVVHDVSGFIEDHPGGRAMINSGIGKDATAMFNGCLPPLQRCTQLTLHHENRCHPW